jgi:hypothetical protein
MQKYLMTAAGIFILGTLLACICSGRWLLSGETNIINALASFNTVEMQAGGGFAIAKGLAGYWNAIVTALSWNYPFLSSPWALFVKIPLWLVSIGVVWGFIEVCLSVAQGLVGLIRNFI